MIELSVGVFDSWLDLRDRLRSVKDQLVDAADCLNIGLTGGGAHPFQQWQDRQIFDKQRFSEPIRFVWLPSEAVYGFWPTHPCRLCERRSSHGTYPSAQSFCTPLHCAGGFIAVLPRRGHPLSFVAIEYNRCVSF